MKEIPFKQWLLEQAQAAGVSPATIYDRLRTGKMKWPKVRRVNSRVIWVREGV